MSKQLRLGFLGGTFDPVHRAHIAMGLQVLDAGYVDRLLVVPSGDPPHKTGVTDAEDRWKMVVSACACDARLVPSRMEIERPGNTYTLDTLTALKREYPGAELFCVIGADCIPGLHSWHRFRELFPLCTFLVCPRASVPETEIRDEMNRLSSLGARFRTVPMEPVEVSSTDVRTALASGVIPECLDVPVREYCRCKGLYGLAGKLDHIDQWIGSLFADLKPRRFAHSLSVADTARRLAKIHGLDPLKAEQAGLLHDCAKCLPLNEMQRIAAEHFLTEDRIILSSGSLLHSLVGACVAEEKYGMNDPEVLDAIRFHNTGLAGMSRLAMCVCLSDSIEPLRRDYPMLREIRALAEISLERALLLSLERTADYVLGEGKKLHPRTLNTIRWLKELPAVREP